MRSAVITIVAGRHDHLSAQRRALAEQVVAFDMHVVVAMGDPAVADVLAAGPAQPAVTATNMSRGDELPLAAARNAGAATAIASGAQLLIFLDVDCLPDADLHRRYRDAATQRPADLLCGPVTYLPPAPAEGWTTHRLAGVRAPHPARPDPPAGELVSGEPALFWSLSFAVTSATWQRIGGFDESFSGYGAEDTDFALRAEAVGVSMTWVGHADAFHQHHPTGTPPVQHVDAILRNGAHFADVWGRWPMPGWLAEFDRLGLVRRDGHTWRRAPLVRLLSIPAAHPYVDAIRPSGAEPVLADRVDGWAPDPLLDPGLLAVAARDIDVVHVHFGYGHLSPHGLRAWLEQLTRCDLPLVVTVHDLRDPHHVDRRRHDEHLRLLLDRAREVVTLTDGAAKELAHRFGVTANVIAHPTLLDLTRPRHGDAARTVLVPLKSLRRNVVDPAAIIRAVADGARDAGGSARVLLHPEASDDPRLADIHPADGLEVDVRSRRTDAELVELLQDVRACVLPYRFGTHSGWIELGRDLGVRVVAPSCGYYAEQWPEVIGYVNDETHTLDAASLRAAVHSALSRPAPQPANRDERVAERTRIRVEHELIYRRLMRA